MGCGGFTTDRYLADPALYNGGGSEVGDSFVWLWAVHPDVTAVRITAEGSSEDLPVYAVDGAGYALYEIPSDITTYTAELLIGDDVCPARPRYSASPSPDHAGSAAPRVGSPGGSHRVGSRGLPELDRVAFRVHQFGEHAVGVVLRMNVHGDTGREQLRDHRVQVANPEIHRPASVAEVS